MLRVADDRAIRGGEKTAADAAIRASCSDGAAVVHAAPGFASMATSERAESRIRSSSSLATKMGVAGTARGGQGAPAGSAKARPKTSWSRNAETSLLSRISWTYQG